MDQINLKAYTLQPTDNSSYLNNYKSPVPSFSEPSGTTTAIMLMLSTLQFQSASTSSSQYAQAADKAGHAAYIQSGGQAFQDKAMSKAEGYAKQAYHYVGITDNQMGVVLGGAKIVKDKQIDVNGPRIYSVRTHLNAAPGQATLGLKFDF